MLVFGGNIEGFGPSDELWALEFPAVIFEENNYDNSSSIVPTWREVTVHGTSPPARTSHTAVIVGRGDSARMVIVGGTTSEKGTGPGSMLCDAWILHLSRKDDSREEMYTWTKLDWSGIGLNRCRHSMAAVNDRTIIWWGGYDGEVAVDDGIGIWRGDLNNNDNNNTNNSHVLEDEEDPNLETIQSKQEDEKKTSYLQERWQAEIPVREHDIPPKILEKVKRSRLPGALYKTIHRHAVANNRDTYIDPASGYSVFTLVYLKRRPCCGNGCRHCPYGHVNVPGRKKLCEEDELDW